MISVQEALTILENNLPEPHCKSVSLSEALGCCLSKDIFAPESSPRYTSSAMDGFAIRWSDYEKSQSESNIGVRLQIIGESQAGVPFEEEVIGGTAIRISTGAMLPKGADTVVRVEDTEESGGFVQVMEVRCHGQDVRYAGEEFKKGELLFHKGDNVGPREMALLASVGMKVVWVFQPPKVSLLITGTELAPYDTEEILSHQIRDSNSIMLASAVSETGAELHATINVEDSFESTVDAINTAVETGADIIICSGGVSVGKHDHVKEAALTVGFIELFWKIRQKPGKPLFVSKLENTLLFGLPGNPVSAYMCFTNYVNPVLANLRGTTSINNSVTAATTETIENKGKRTNFVRVKVLEKPSKLTLIQEVAQQGSHMLSSIVQADGYIIVKPGEVMEAGSLVEVILFQ